MKLKPPITTTVAGMPQESIDMLTARGIHPDQSGRVIIPRNVGLTVYRINPNPSPRRRKAVRK